MEEVKKYYIKLVGDADDVRALFIEDEDGCVYQAADVDAYVEKVERYKAVAEKLIGQLNRFNGESSHQTVREYEEALAVLEEENA